MPTGLPNQGKIAQQVGSIDWSNTPIGQEANWPKLLVNAVNMCLNVPYPSLVLWGKSHLVFYNDAFGERIGNLDARHVLGQAAEFAIPKLWEWISTTVQEAVRTGEAFGGESLLLGDDLPVIWTLVPLVGEQGGIQGALCTWTLDRAEVLALCREWKVREDELCKRLLKSEASLRSEARFREVAENSVDTIAITDARGRFTYVSSSSDEVLGYEAEDLLGRPLFDFLPSTEMHHLRNEFTQLVHSPGSVATLSFSFQHKTAGACYLAIRAKNLLDSEGIGGVLLNIRDVSESKVLETQLRRAKEHAEELVRLKSSLLANMSHEIRTPLTSILGVASMVAEKVPEEFRDSMRMIERGGARLAETLNSVLLLAQFESHAVAMNLEKVDLVESVEEVVRALRPLANERNLYLSVLADEPEIYGLVDRMFFARIMTNLLGNALKFTKEGGVTVELRLRSSQVEINVCDTGIGIKKGFISKVFDEFSQENAGLEGASQGSGLGLAITQRLVTALGGSITVRSRPGKGTTFTVKLKRSDQDVLDSQKVPEDSAQCDKLLRQKVAAIDPELHILVVEDNEAIRALVRQQLETICRVTVCTNAESALVEARKHDFDVIFMDIGLPGMSGSDAVRELRADSRYETSPIIALTGYAMPGDREQILESGFSHYVEKPFSFQELVDVILLSTQASDLAPDLAPDLADDE